MDAAARTPSPFVAQCSPIDASRLPLRRRSSQNNTPARPVNRTVPSTEMTWPDVPFPTVLPIAWSSAARPSDGSTCHKPNSAEETMVAVSVPCPRRSRPHEHPAEGDFLEYHCAQRDEQESGEQGMLQVQVVAGVAEGVPCQRQRRAHREHHGHGSDRTGRPDQPAPPRSAAQAEFLPAEPSPTGDGQEPRGAAGRAPATHVPRGHRPR